MRYLVGLGNPGPDHSGTRHNLGYRVAEVFAGRLGARRFRERGRLLAATVRVAGQEVTVAKPQTFMNESGSAVRELVGGSVEAEDLLVAHDDLDLELGTVRVKKGGGDGGQRGIRSIIAELGTEDFVRIRLGIRRPSRDIDAAEWVLESFAAINPDLAGATCMWRTPTYTSEQLAQEGLAFLREKAAAVGLP